MPLTVTVVGGAGYTGGELLRLLLNHPELSVTQIISGSQAGNPVAALHPDLTGEDLPDFVSSYQQHTDVLFMCTPHGKAKVWLESTTLPEGTLVIDLSNDFRLAGEHPFIYALPEFNREEIKGRRHLANPGCFATAIQLALLPLSQMGGLPSQVHIHATTGSTGAGQALSETGHFSWRSNNLSVYKPYTHQHLAEINHTLQRHGASPQLWFVPYRGSFTRGILAACSIATEMSQEEATKLYKEYYASHPFTHVVDELPDLKQVVNSNRCHIGLHQQGGMLLVVSVIDNLLKGASGQAVQNMNIALGWDETLGLRLKGGGF